MGTGRHRAASCATRRCRRHMPGRWPVQGRCLGCVAVTGAEPRLCPAAGATLLAAHPPARERQCAVPPPFLRARPERGWCVCPPFRSCPQAHGLRPHHHGRDWRWCAEVMSRGHMRLPAPSCPANPAALQQAGCCHHNSCLALLCLTTRWCACLPARPSSLPRSLSYSIAVLG